jgi:hypothetical protein
MQGPLKSKKKKVPNLFIFKMPRPVYKGGGPRLAGDCWSPGQG